MGREPFVWLRFLTSRLPNAIKPLMNLTLELPNELYRAAMIRAASQKREVKDLVAQGLEAVLAQPPGNDGEFARVQEQTLVALDEILRCAPAPEGRTRYL